MTTFLTFQLYGPMASWGEVAVGEERDTRSSPTRSAVLGLCAAAMGIPRDAEEEILELNRSIGFAVCIHSEGSVLRDYHTIESPSGKRARDLPSRRKELEYYNTGTMLSKRQYLTDAYYVVSLWRRDGAARDDVLTHLASALAAPTFTLYLGRKSCPLALPLAPRTAEFDSLREAFAAYPVDWHLADNWRIDTDRARITWDADARIKTDLTPSQRTTRWDRVVSRERWQFGRRDEAMTSTSFED